MKLDLSKAKLGAPGTPLEGLSLVRHKHGDKCGIYGVRFPEINATCQGMPVCFLIHETGDVTWMYDASIVIIPDDPVEEWRDMQIATKGGDEMVYLSARVRFVAGVPVDGTLGVPDAPDAAECVVKRVRMFIDNADGGFNCVKEMVFPGGQPTRQPIRFATAADAHIRREQP